MTAAGEDPIAVIQWPAELVDREWPLWGKSNVRWRPSTANHGIAIFCPYWDREPSFAQALATLDCD
jgi:hypothetical protein